MAKKAEGLKGLTWQMISFVFIAAVCFAFGAPAATTQDILQKVESKEAKAFRLNLETPFFQALEARPEFSKDSRQMELRFKLTPQYLRRKELEKQILLAKTKAGNLERQQYLLKQKALIHSMLFAQVSDFKKLSYVDNVLKKLDSISPGQTGDFQTVISRSEFEGLKRQLQDRLKTRKQFLLDIFDIKDKKLSINSNVRFASVRKAFDQIKDIPFEKSLSYSNLNSQVTEIKALKKMEALDRESYMDFVGVEGTLEGQQELALTMSYTIPFGEGAKEDFKEHEIEYEKLYGKAEYAKAKSNVAHLLEEAARMDKTIATLEEIFKKTYSSAEVLGAKLEQQEKLLSLFIKAMETKEEAFAAFLEFLGHHRTDIKPVDFWSVNAKS